MILNQPTIDAQRATHLFNMQAQYLEQFAWLDEHLSNHGTLPSDWRSACHSAHRKDPSRVHGTLRADQAVRS